MNPVITYFPIRGRAEPIRLILEEVSIPYDENRVQLRDWKTLKPSMPFKALPCYQEGDLTIVESRAVCRYLARKYQLYGSSEDKMIRCDILDEAIRDAETALGGLFWDADFDSKQESFKKKQLVFSLRNFENYLASYPRSPEYCVGNAITFVDFVLWNYLDWVRAFSYETLLQFPILMTIKTAVEARPNIQTYLRSSRRPSTITVPMATFGGTPETS